MKMIATLLLLFSTTVMAAEKQKYLVMEWNNKSRILLTKDVCQVKGLTGSKASVQRLDGAYIRGCWKYSEHNPDHVRIDWENPKQPGDFAVLELNRFQYVEE